MKRMRVAVIGCKGLPPLEGGIEHHCAEIYTRLSAEGHIVDLFARSSYTRLSSSAEKKYRGVRIISLPGSKFNGLDALVNSALSTLATFTRRYDIIHYHALGPSLWLWLPILLGRSKVVVTCHGLDWQRSKWGKLPSKIIRLGEEMAVRHAHHIIVVSEELERYFWEKYRRKTSVICNAPAGYSECSPNFSYGTGLGLEREKYILFLGRLVPEKNPDLLIKAFRQLQTEGWKLVLAGRFNGNLAFNKYLQEIAADRTDIIFTNELHGERLAEIVRNAGIFTLPSAVEGMPLALLEAMREKVPVIVSDLPVHRKLIGEDRGLLFRTNDLESLRSKLEWSLRNITKMKVMASKAKANVEMCYDWGSILGEHLKIYDQVLVSQCNRSHSPPLSNEESRVSAVLEGGSE